MLQVEISCWRKCLFQEVWSNLSIPFGRKFFCWRYQAKNRLELICFGIVLTLGGDIFFKFRIYVVLLECSFDVGWRYLF